MQVHLAAIFEWGPQSRPCTDQTKKKNFILLDIYWSFWLQKKDWEGPRMPSAVVLDVTFDILFFRPIES